MKNKIIQGFLDVFYICGLEFRQTFKDIGLIIFFVVVPVVYPLLYSWFYNNQFAREVPVAVVDISNSSDSREFLRLYDASPDVCVHTRCNNLEEAKIEVAKQNVMGVIYIPETFAKDIARHKQVVVSVYCDMSVMLNYKAILQTATSVVGKMNSDIQIESTPTAVTVREEAVTTKPLAFDEVPIFSSAGGYGDFIIPAVLVLILYQTLLLGIGMGAGTVRETDKYGRLIPANRHYQGLHRAVFGKALFYFLLYTLMSSYMLLVVPKMFGWVHLIHLDDLAAFLVPFLLSTIFFGMTMTHFVHHRETVMLIVVFASVPLLFLTGVSWPESNMPVFWRSFAYLFPSTCAVRAFVRLNSMGATLPDVMFEYKVMWVHTIIYMVTAFSVYRINLRRALKMTN